MKGFGNNNKSKKRKKYKLQNQNQYYQILDQAIKYQSKGFITQASELYEFLIKNRFKESIVFANYGIILINSGGLKEEIVMTIFISNTKSTEIYFYKISL